MPIRAGNDLTLVFRPSHSPPPALKQFTLQLAETISISVGCNDFSQFTTIQPESQNLKREKQRPVLNWRDDVRGDRFSLLFHSRRTSTCTRWYGSEIILLFRIYCHGFVGYATPLRTTISFGIILAAATAE